MEDPHDDRARAGARAYTVGADIHVAPGEYAPDTEPGQRLLAHVCECARTLGARDVWMQVNKRNERAIGAYLKAGFRIEKEAVFDIGGGFVMAG